MSWEISVSSAETTKRVTFLFKDLSVMTTAHEARVNLVNAFFPGELPEAVLRVWGDFDTRLTGVYTGNDTPAPNGWYQ